MVEDSQKPNVGRGLLTDAERADPPPIGSRVTYRHNGFTTNGIPRFARFLRVRPPLSPASIEDRAREQ